MTTTSAARTRPKIFRARRIGNDPYKPGGPLLAPFMLRLATNAPGVLRTRALRVTGNDCRGHPSKTWVSSRRLFPRRLVSRVDRGHASAPDHLPLSAGGAPGHGRSRAP